MIRPVVMLILSTMASAAMLQKPRKALAHVAETHQKSLEEKEYEEMFYNFTHSLPEDSLNPLSGLPTKAQGKANILREVNGDAKASNPKVLKMREEVKKPAPPVYEPPPTSTKSKAAVDKWKKKLDAISKDFVPGGKAYNPGARAMGKAEWADAVESVKKAAEKKTKDKSKRSKNSTNPLGSDYDIPLDMLVFWSEFVKLKPVNAETASLKENVLDMFCTEFPNLSGCTVANIQSCQEIGDCTTGSDGYLIIGDEIYKVAKGFGVSKKEVEAQVGYTAAAEELNQDALTASIVANRQVSAPAEDLAAAVEAYDDPAFSLGR